MEYYISGGADGWTKVGAATLNGAKALASKSYQPAVGGRIEVAIAKDERFVTVAVKRGFGPWYTDR